MCVCVCACVLCPRLAIVTPMVLCDLMFMTDRVCDTVCDVLLSYLCDQCSRTVIRHVLMCVSSALQVCNDAEVILSKVFCCFCANRGHQTACVYLGNSSIQKRKITKMISFVFPSRQQ